MQSYSYHNCSRGRVSGRGAAGCWLVRPVSGCRGPGDRDRGPCVAEPGSCCATGPAREFKGCCVGHWLPGCFASREPVQSPLLKEPIPTVQRAAFRRPRAGLVFRRQLNFPSHAPAGRIHLVDSWRWPATDHRHVFALLRGRGGRARRSHAAQCCPGPHVSAMGALRGRRRGAPGISGPWDGSGLAPPLVRKWHCLLRASAVSPHAATEHGVATTWRGAARSRCSWVENWRPGDPALVPRHPRSGRPVARPRASEGT